MQRLQAGEGGLALYSEVDTQEETVAIGFGVVGPGTDIDEIVDLVWSTGKELEDSSKVRGRIWKNYHEISLYLLNLHFA